MTFAGVVEAGRVEEEASVRIVDLCAAFGWNIRIASLAAPLLSTAAVVRPSVLADGRMGALLALIDVTASQPASSPFGKTALARS